MKEQQKQTRQTRILTWFTSAPSKFLLWLVAAPIDFVADIVIAFSPKKPAEKEVAAFRKLTPEQRWNRVKKPGWTNEKLVKERMTNWWLSYFFLACSMIILLCAALAYKYLNWVQIFGALAYSGAAFIMFAKRSMRIYALDNRKVILFEEWLMIPGDWLK